jgi:hypothetical protein
MFTAQAAAQSPRTWVSGVGDDANPCSRSAPCLTFAGAIGKTASGGEMHATDAGAFGTVTITKAITIDVSSVGGGTLNPGVSGVVINAPATAAVVLRGLDIHGSTAGAIAPCTQAGLYGIRVLNAGSVHIEDTKIGSQTIGMSIVPAQASKVFLNRVDIADSCTGGINSSGSGRTELAIRDSTISTSGTALSVADNTTAWLSGSTLSSNALGLRTLGTGVINDFGNNRFAANTVDGAATNNLAPVPPAGPPGAAGAAGPAGAAGTPGVAGPAGAPAFKLLLATSSSRRTVRKGAAVTVRFAATAAASCTLTISRSGKTLRRLRFASRAGSNAVRWNGRIGTARSSAGAYTLTLRAVGADGQIATNAVAVTVKGR